MKTRRVIARSRTRKQRRQRKQRGGSAAKSSPLFQNAYAITMEEFPERFERIKHYANAAQLPLMKWPGVKVTPYQINMLPPLGVGTTHFKDRTGKIFNLGVIGAFLAHRNLYKKIADNDQDKMGTLIFEDDVAIPIDFFDRLAAVAGEVPEDWDILFLDKFRVDATKVSEHIQKLKKDMTGQKNWGIWSYIVKNKSVKDKILPVMEHMLDVPDIQLAKFADKINMYLLIPSIVQPDQKTSRDSVISKLDLQ